MRKSKWGPVAVKFPYGRTVHILDDDGSTLCGAEIKKNSVYYYRLHLSIQKVCNRCYEAIGKEMITQYLGIEEEKKPV
jgi:hypothetical protein